MSGVSIHKIIGPDCQNIKSINYCFGVPVHCWIERSEKYEIALSLHKIFVGRSTTVQIIICIMVPFESNDSEIIIITGQRSCVERAQRMILHIVKMEKSSERERLFISNVYVSQ